MKAITAFAIDDAPPLLADSHVYHCHYHYYAIIIIISLIIVIDIVIDIGH